MRAASCGLLALAQILAFAHLATVGHQTCLEHGEAIHAGTRLSIPAEQRTPVLAARSASSDSEGHEHEHCLSAAHGRAKLVLPPPAAMGVLVLCLASSTWADTARSFLADVDLLALAPKGSPPVS